MAIEILASDNFEVGKNWCSISIMMGTIQLEKIKQDRTFMSPRATYLIKDDVSEVVEIDEDTYPLGLGDSRLGDIRFCSRRTSWCWSGGLL